MDNSNLDMLVTMQVELINGHLNLMRDILTGLQNVQREDCVIDFKGSLKKLNDIFEKLASTGLLEKAFVSTLRERFRGMVEEVEDFEKKCLCE